MLGRQIAPLQCLIKKEVNTMELELEKVTSGPSLAKEATGSGSGKGDWTSKCSG